MGISREKSFKIGFQEFKSVSLCALTHHSQCLNVVLSVLFPVPQIQVFQLSSCVDSTL